MKKRVTIKDIAAAAGCSANCVSRALMDAPDISEKRKKEIRGIADQMGYIFNRSAAALRQGQSKIIGIVVDSFIEPRYFVMINFFWDRLAERDYTIIVFRFHGTLFGVDLAKQLIAAGAAGAIAFSPPTKEAQQLLDKNKIASVVLGRDADGLCDNVVLDDRFGGGLAAQHFLDRGLRRPLYLGETRRLDYSVRRGEGFGAECARRGVQARIVSRDDIPGYDYRKYLEDLFRNGDLPDCIFCFSDFIACILIKEMHRLKISGIPVIGFDNIQQEIVMPIPLTSVSYDKRQVADLAVDLLFSKIDKGKGGHVEKKVFSELVIVNGEDAI